MIGTGRLTVDQQLNGAVYLSRCLREAEEEVRCGHCGPALQDIVVMFDAGLAVHAATSLFSAIAFLQDQQ